MSGDTDGTRCFAVRRVNPFEGVLQVVELPDARAYSANGRTWRVQVLARRPDHSWRSFSQVPPIEQFFNFGLWDAADGLHRVPANPMLDIGSMSDAAQRLADALTTRTGRLPFALIDDYECWATDRRGHPVALLATTEDPQRMTDLHIGPWQATRPPDHGFVSPSLLASGVPAHGDLGPRRHAEQLEHQVRRRDHRHHWYRRQADGRRARLDAEGGGGESAEQRFPVLGLTTDWPDPAAAALARDYLAWQAPLLLTLQELDDAQRHWLEQEAVRQAPALAANYPLIPRIIDRQAIEAARVEARLRQATRAGGGTGRHETRS